MALVGTYDGLVRVVDGLVKAGCCCTTCIPGNEPTANFSYEQTDDDPCKIDLTDESTVHENCADGEIVEWKWYKNDVLISTNQNPGPTVVEDGDEIRLWVKDSCGCTDEVVGSIDCAARFCPQCPDSMPLTATVVLNGLRLTTSGSPLCPCWQIDGESFLLTRYESNDCVYLYAEVAYTRKCYWPPDTPEEDPLNQVGTDYRVSMILTFSSTDITLDVTVLHVSFGSNWNGTFSIARTDSDLCQGTHTLNYVPNAGFTCGINGTSTAQVTL